MGLHGNRHDFLLKIAIYENFSYELNFVEYVEKSYLKRICTSQKIMLLSHFINKKLFCTLLHCL